MNSFHRGKGLLWRRRRRRMAAAGGADAQKKAKQAERKWGLVSFSELPDYMQDNEFILRYYRANWPLKEAFLSIFRWHNETLNIWTHLIGFFVFLVLTMEHAEKVPKMADLLSGFTGEFLAAAAVVVNSSEHPITFFPENARKMRNEEMSAAARPAARWPFFVFLGGSMFCLLTSSVCHLFCCHSRRLSLFLARVDYAGIAVMIVASFFPPIYYIFQCEPWWQVLYLSGITALGVATVATLLSPTFTSGAFRAFRALLFAAMGLSGLVPAVHAAVVNWEEPKRNVTLAYEAAMAAAYLTGTMFYVSRVPERWRPGTFDLAGHSHQIFHVFVIVGALAHYAATIVFLKWRDSVGCE